MPHIPVPPALAAFAVRSPSALLRRIQGRIDWMLRRQWANYRRTLERQVDGHGFESLLDIGCGRASPLREVLPRIPRTVGVDAHAPSIEASRAAGLHSEYVLSTVDALDEHFAPRTFDVVVATELIEHLPKEQGLRLLDTMERLARRRVVVMTPNGFVRQDAYDGNEYRRHLSGWSVAEMRALGYRVVGANGWRPLRGMYAAVRWRPRWLWERISWLTQDWAARHPEHAFHICCVKDLSEADAARASATAGRERGEVPVSARSVPPASSHDGEPGARVRS